MRNNNKFGKIGFILSIVPIALSLLMVALPIGRFMSVFDGLFYKLIISVGSFVILLLPIVSVVCCIIQLKRNKTGLAIAGLIISLLVIISLGYALVRNYLFPSIVLDIFLVCKEL